MKIVLFEYISDCLGKDMVGNNVVSEFGGLNCIIEPSSSDLMHDTLFITRCELGRTTTFAVFLILIDLFLDPGNCRLA